MRPPGVLDNPPHLHNLKVLAGARLVPILDQPAANARPRLAAAAQTHHELHDLLLALINLDLGVAAAANNAQAVWRLAADMAAVGLLGNLAATHALVDGSAFEV